MANPYRHDRRDDTSTLIASSANFAMENRRKAASGWKVDNSYFTLLTINPKALESPALGL